MYTTTSGIIAVPLSSLSGNQLPANYDYAVNTFAFVQGTMSGTQTIPSRYNFQLTGNSTIAIAFNSMLQFVCYDGVNWNSDPYGLGN